MSKKKKGRAKKKRGQITMANRCGLCFVIGHSKRSCPLNK